MIGIVCRDADVSDRGLEPDVENLALVAFPRKGMLIYAVPSFHSFTIEINVAKEQMRGKITDLLTPVAS